MLRSAALAESICCFDTAPGIARGQIGEPLIVRFGILKIRRGHIHRGLCLIHIGPGFFDLAAGLLKFPIHGRLIGLGLIERDLVISRVQFDDHISLMNGLVVHHRHRFHQRGNLRADGDDMPFNVGVIGVLKMAGVNRKSGGDAGSDDDRQQQNQQQRLPPAFLMAWAATRSATCEVAELAEPLVDV